MEEKVDVQQAVYFKQKEMNIITKIAEEEERTNSNWIRKLVLDKLVQFKEAKK